MTLRRGRLNSAIKALRFASSQTCMDRHPDMDIMTLRLDAEVERLIDFVDGLELAEKLQQLRGEG